MGWRAITKEKIMTKECFKLVLSVTCLAILVRPLIPANHVKPLGVCE